VSWLNCWFQVPDLFHHLVANGHDYDAVVFSPYLFWTTSVCLEAVVERAVVIPCLHDEPYARLEILRPVLSDPAAVWFLSEPEHQLAHRLGPVAPRHEVTGGGVHVPSRYDPEGFRARHGIERPFVLFAGRREGGKGWDWLLDAFDHAVTELGVDLDLVTFGVGEVAPPPPSISGRVIDLGFVDAGERDDAFAAATVYVQASRMESFSRTIMEAWLAGTPVVARADSEVVAWHCERSGGGMTFRDVGELADRLRQIQDHPDEAAAMAAKGREYVLEHYTWDPVLDRMESALEGLT
jgi:glycosyltransferase involved in cell wall biosynthesis